MTYEQVKEMYEAETNPAIKGIYLNHLKRMEGKSVDCGNCTIEVVEDVVHEDSVDVVEEPVEAKGKK